MANGGGYREKGDTPLLEAVVEAVDYDNPQSPRVKLHFPGAQPVVMRDSHPAGRLKCRWEDHEDFLAAEENWENLVYSDRVGDPVMEAAHRLAFEAVIPWDVAEEADSTIHVSDPDRFAELTGIPLAELAAIDGAFWTDGVRPERARRVSYHESTLYGRQDDTFHLPRGAMDRVARALRDRYVEAILRDVDEQEERARLARVTGYLGESYVGVDDAVASDEKPSGRPAGPIHPTITTPAPTAAPTDAAGDDLRDDLRDVIQIALDAISELRTYRPARAERFDARPRIYMGETGQQG